MTPPVGAPPAIGWQWPPFYCPLPEAIHPRAGQIAAAAIAWADAVGLFPDETERDWTLATNAPEFGCRAFPDGAEDIMTLFTQWNYAGWLTDDWHDSGASAAETAAFNARLLRTVQAPRAGLLGGSPLARSIADLAARSHDLLSPTQLGLVAAGLRDWLHGAGWQVANIERRTMPSLNEFAAMTGLVNGTNFSLAWGEAATGITLAPEERYAPPVIVLAEAAGFVVSSDNDLFSYAKDDHPDLPEPNLVNVIAHRDGTTARAALPRAVALRDRVMSLFLRLRDQVLDDASPDLRRYVAMLETYISGAIRWQSTAARYASPRNRSPVPVPGAAFPITYTATPSDPSKDPPPVPAIAWWWTQLA